MEGRLKTLRKALKEFSNKTDITHQVFIGENTETDLETFNQDLKSVTKLINKTMSIIVSSIYKRELFYYFYLF